MVLTVGARSTRTDRSFGRRRLEDDPQPRTGRLREALQRVRGRTDLTTLDACDIGLRSVHPLGELRLRQARGRPRLDQCPRQVELFTECVVRVLVVGVLAPTAMEIVDLRHGFTSTCTDRVSEAGKKSAGRVQLPNL